MKKRMHRKTMLFVERRTTPIGTIVVMTDSLDRVRAVEFEDHEDRMRRLLETQFGTELSRLLPRPSTSDAARRLEAYFSGDLSALDGAVVATAGTPFQEQVWAALRTIPAGRTMSYSALAAAIGRPKAVRAVGLANGSNPVGVIVPCHRVIGADRSLTGYGGGLARKEWLLAHEGVRSFRALTTVLPSRLSPRALRSAAGSWA